MNKLIVTALLFFSVSAIHAQAVGHVIKKTKEFSVPPNLKTEYRIFGYEFPSDKTKKMICFSSSRADVNDNFNKCPLGSYYDTNRMNPGDNIRYITEVHGFGKMLYTSAAGKKAIFYLPKSTYTVK